MRPLGFPKIFKTACDIVGRKRLCRECLNEALAMKQLKNGRTRQKIFNNWEIEQGFHEMNEEKINPELTFFENVV